MVKKNIHDMYRKKRDQASSYEIPTNICICIKSTRLLELASHINQIISQRNSDYLT